jgi:hypothetical protein
VWAVPTPVLGRAQCYASVAQAGRIGTVQLGRGGFNLVAFDLFFFLFSEYIQILANSKNCVGFV